VHEVDVLGQRLAQRAGHRLDAPVGHQPAPDLGLDLLAELVDARVVLVHLQPLLERRQRLGRLLPGLLHELVEHAVEVEVPQRPVEVVGAADRPARLHAGVAAHRLAGDRLEHGLVALGQRPEQHLGQLLGRQRLAAGAPHPPLVALGLGLHLAHEVLEVGHRLGRLVGEGVLAAPQREVDLEDRLEHPPVGGVLHQRRRQRVLERVAVADRDVLDGGHRVEVLGQADRQAGRPQLADEPRQQLGERDAGADLGEPGRRLVDRPGPPRALVVAGGAATLRSRGCTCARVGAVAAGPNACRGRGRAAVRRRRGAADRLVAVSHRAARAWRRRPRRPRRRASCPARARGWPW
jgi:hypothetical protein